MLVINDIYNEYLKSSNILVVGDIIYDNYLLGDVSRISPASSVPVFTPHNEVYSLGGAANVFQTILSLGANAQLCGIIGNDKEGMNLLSKFDSLSNSRELILVNCERPTTKKTRLLAENNYILRIDEEITSEISDETEIKAFSIIKKRIDLYDILVVSDYDKGFLKNTFVRKVFDLFIDRNKKIIVDPKSDFFKYAGALLIKPNVNELNQLIFDSNIYNDYNLLSRYCKTILNKGNFNYIYVTLGDNGGFLIGRDDCHHKIPALGGKAIDTIGAGDATLAALAVAIAAKADILKAVYFASCVAGISVSKRGTSTVTKSEVISWVCNQHI